jgi:hypothetical protein
MPPKTDLKFYQKEAIAPIWSLPVQIKLINVTWMEGKLPSYSLWNITGWLKQKGFILFTQKLNIIIPLKKLM